MSMEPHVWPTPTVGEFLITVARILHHQCPTYNHNKNNVFDSSTASVSKWIIYVNTNRLLTYILNIDNWFKYIFLKIQAGFALIAKHIDQSNCSFSGINMVYWCLKYITIIKNDVDAACPARRRVVRSRVCIHISFEHDEYHICNNVLW